MLLARGLGRQRELHRAALGASRGVYPPIVNRDTLIAVAGGASGLLLAQWASTPPQVAENFVRTGDASLDTRVLLFAFSLSLLTVAVRLACITLAKPQLPVS